MGRYHRLTWGCGAVGSARDWQSRGQGFDPPQLHQSSKNTSSTKSHRNLTKAQHFRRLASLTESVRKHQSALSIQSQDTKSHHKCATCVPQSDSPVCCPVGRVLRHLRKREFGSLLRESNEVIPCCRIIVIYPPIVLGDTHQRLAIACKTDGCERVICRCDTV